MNSSQPQDFPWQTVYDERLGLGGDVAWMEAHIRHLRYTADQLEPRLAAMRLRLNHLHDVTEYNENRPRPRLSAGPLMLLCSGCGKTYPENDIEGEFHDHWTAASDAGEDKPGYLCERRQCRGYERHSLLRHWLGWMHP